MNEIKRLPPDLERLLNLYTLAVVDEAIYGESETSTGRRRLEYHKKSLAAREALVAGILAAAAPVSGTVQPGADELAEADPSQNPDRIHLSPAGRAKVQELAQRFGTEYLMRTHTTKDEQ